MSELSNKELNGFLDEIDADESLIIGGLTLEEAQKKGAASNKEKAIDRKRRQQEIIQEAINSTFIDLNAPLSVAHKRILIKLLTEEYTALMVKQENYINAKITGKFKQIIPRELYNTWLNYKQSFIPLEGFMYTASQEYGDGLQFKVSVDLPFHYHPDDCERIFKENWPNDVPIVDRAVKFFHKYKNTRSEREVKIAEQLTRIQTFFQLVKKNPFWYDKLVQELKRREENGDTD